MIWLGALLAIVVMGLSIVAIEKKRAAGTLTYPLWRGNLFIPWGMLVLVFVVLMGALNLPQVVGLILRGQPADAVVNQTGDYCKVTYSYKVAGKEYKGVDSRCGLKVGNTHRVFYDRDTPESSSLTPPRTALEGELMAIAAIALCLPTLIVLWLMMTKVIGRRLKA